jgi:hypothetical protein
MTGTLENIFQDKGYTVSIIPLANAAMVSCVLGNPMSILTAGCGNAEFVKQYSEMYAPAAQAQNAEMKLKDNWFYYGTQDAVALFESIDLNKEYQYMSDNHFEKIEDSEDDDDSETTADETMEEKLNKVYNKIANHLNSVIPIEWDKVYLLGEVEKEQASYSATFYCIESGTKDIKRCFKLMDEHGIDDHIAHKDLMYMILELNNCFKDEGKDLWEQVSFCLENTGKFNVEFFYDVMHENDGGGLPREVVWANKTFGFNPPEGNYLRKLLDQYKGKNSLLNPNEFEIDEDTCDDTEKGAAACERLIGKWTPELETKMLDAFIKLYYDDMYKNWGPDDDEENEEYWPEIKTPNDLLKHTGTAVSLYALEDGLYAKSKTAEGKYESQNIDVCVILKIECPWDDEHGWAAVFIDEEFVKVDRDIVDCVYLDNYDEENTAEPEAAKQQKKINSLIKENPEMIEADFDSTSAGDEEIAEAEKTLNLKFPESYIWFLKKGKYAYDLIGSPESCVAETKRQREKGLPLNLAVISNNGEFVECIDTSTGKIISWSSHDKDGEMESFADFYAYYLDFLENAIDDF